MKNMNKKPSVILKIGALEGDKIAVPQKSRKINYPENNKYVNSDGPTSQKEAGKFT